ncbi:MAG: ABC transporter permease, partial [Chloroflexi bacterium]|nr:ABC transporter permease [Chloroflexota bacterium]
MRLAGPAPEVSVILYAIRRLLIAIPLLWAVLTLVFLSVHLVPGDPVQIMLAGKADAKTVASFRHQLGLDQPLPVQYWNFLVHAAHLDFGRSVRSNQPVWTEILQRWPFTLQLAVCAMVLATILAFIQGVLAALLNRTWIGTSVVGITLLGLSIPDFWLGTMLALIFGVRLGWLPVQGTGDIRNLVLPSLTLAIGISAVLARVIRSSLV